MEQIINDLKSALARMNERSDKFSDKTEELEAMIVSANKKIADIAKREEAVLAKEELYAGYDDIAKLRAEVKSDKIAIAKDRISVDAISKEMASAKIAVDADRKKVADMIALYKQKLVNCDDQLKQLAEDKKNLEKKVIEELTKKLASK